MPAAPGAKLFEKLSPKLPPVLAGIDLQHLRHRGSARALDLLARNDLDRCDRLLIGTADVGTGNRDALQLLLGRWLAASVARTR